MASVTLGLDDGCPFFPGAALELHPSILDPDGAHDVCETSSWAGSIVRVLLHQNAVDGLKWRDSVGNVLHGLHDVLEPCG